MAFNIREFLGLSEGSQAGMGELYVMEKLLEHYSPGHDSDSIFDNPKFGYNPENPSQAILKSDDTCFALDIEYDGPTPAQFQDCRFTYKFPLCF